MPTVSDFQELTNTLAIQYGYAAYAHHLTATAGWADNMNGLDTNVDKKIISGAISKRQHALCIRCLKEK